MNTRFLILFMSAFLLLRNASAEGIGNVSFREEGLLCLRSNPALLKIVATLDIKNEGRCLLDLQADGTAKHILPFTFFARLNGSKGDYDLVLIIDHIEALSNIARSTQTMTLGGALKKDTIGVVVLPLTKTAPVSEKP
jgi:hypothetical protein